MELQREKVRFFPSLRPTRITQRAKYEAEVDVIKKRFGGLDDMRKALDLSRRQICQILLVDPSAWTRWTSSDEAAPAHVYKTLALIMEQNFRDPNRLAEIKVRSQLNDQGKKSEHLASALTKAQGQLHEVESTMHDLRAELRGEMNSQFETLKKSLNETAVLSFGWKLLLILNIVLVLYVVFR